MADNGGTTIPSLDLIDLDQAGLVGYRRFISCWLGRGGSASFVVDPGPRSTAPLLLRRLQERGVAALDFILLTHVHLDHGGAAADLLAAYPRARVYCHAAGRRHLTGPGRLWEGSRQVLGEVAAIYGEPRPVPPEALADQQELAAAGITAIPTPGHAPHHESFLVGDALFVGEAAGTFLDLGEHGWYLRPATPPRFILEIALASLDRLLALRPQPRRLAFAHHGLLVGGTRELLALARDQHRTWVATVRQTLAEQPGGSAAVDPDRLGRLVAERLAAADPGFARRRFLPPDIRRREEDFTRQSLRGMVEYVLAGGAG